MSQPAFGALGGVQKQAQLKYEKGERYPDATYFEALAKVGVDVLYIITGVRSPAALQAEEQLLLERFRACAPSLRDAALRVLLGGAEGKAGNSTVIHGNVGPRIEGDLTLDTMTINMGNKYKK